MKHRGELDVKKRRMIGDDYTRSGKGIARLAEKTNVQVRRYINQPGVAVADGGVQPVSEGAFRKWNSPQDDSQNGD